MAEYTYITGLGRIFDPEIGAWREPMTEDELWAAQRLDDHLKHSLVKAEGYDG